MINLHDRANQPYEVYGCDLAIVFNGKPYNYSELRRSCLADDDFVDKRDLFPH